METKKSPKKGKKSATTKTSTVAPVVTTEQTKFPVVRQDWLESEAGWGCRPDGYSLHLTEADRVQYCKEYWARQPKRDAQGNPPHEYSRECGSPTVVDVDAETYAKVKASKNGVRY